MSNAPAELKDLPHLNRPVIFSPDAQRDMRGLYAYIAKRSGEDRALGYVSRIEITCQSLTSLPERGTLREDRLPGLRTMGFEKRVLIAFKVEARHVTVLRVLYGGRDLGKAFRRVRG